MNKDNHTRLDPSVLENYYHMIPLLLLQSIMPQMLVFNNINLLGVALFPSVI